VVPLSAVRCGKCLVNSVPRELLPDPPDSSGEQWTLIAGLGNPGRDYAAHRHNIGFQCIDALAQFHGIPLTRKRFKAIYGEGRIAESRVVLLKPQTFMNESGTSVVAASHWYRVPPERIVVIHDDLDLPFGRIRLRPGGSSGGHNGVQSIITELGSADFLRVRVGIGRPSRGDPIDYVLNPFDRDQAPYIPDICARVNEAIVALLSLGIKEAMNLYNGMEPVGPAAEAR